MNFSVGIYQIKIVALKTTIEVKESVTDCSPRFRVNGFINDVSIVTSFKKKKLSSFITFHDFTLSTFHSIYKRFLTEPPYIVDGNSDSQSCYYYSRWVRNCTVSK